MIAGRYPAGLVGSTGAAMMSPPVRRSGLDATTPIGSALPSRLRRPTPGLVLASIETLSAAEELACTQR